MAVDTGTTKDENSLTSPLTGEVRVRVNTCPLTLILPLQGGGDCLKDIFVAMTN